MSSAATDYAKTEGIKHNQFLNTIFYIIVFFNLVTEELDFLLD